MLYFSVYLLCRKSSSGSAIDISYINAINKFNLINTTSYMSEIFELIWERKVKFLITFFVVFMLSYVLLVAIDFLPEAPTSEEVVEVEDVVSVQYDPAYIDYLDGDDYEEEGVELVESEEEVIPSVSDPMADVVVAVSEPVNIAPVPDVVVQSDSVLPVSIYIKKLDKTVRVLNPNSRVIADLDTALLSGVVRHPDSATLGQDGNVFILGHSSYLPTVFNKNFQAFNGIQNLAWGDIIEVSSGDVVYQYRVEKVYRAVAQDLVVPIAGDKKKLTLATCNSFGSVDDRYIVEAVQINVRSL